MDSRTAAYVLTQIADLLELGGENRFKVRAYRGAARALVALGADDLAPALRSGELQRVPGLGSATLAVIRDLVEKGESAYLERLKDSVPEGAVELSHVPGLSREKINVLHAELGIASLAELETAARDGRLAKVKGIGPKTVEKILAGIAFRKTARVLKIYPHAAIEANAILAAVRSHPQVERAEIAGSIRRRREVIGDVDIVAACRGSPANVARSFARTSGIRSATGDGPNASIEFVDGTRLDLYCVTPAAFGEALWRATGNEEHVRQVAARIGHDSGGDEAGLYARAGLQWIPPELREGTGEVDAAAEGLLPRLVDVRDIRGALHCHSTYSDGKASIAEMAEAARALGWSYLGISDHSQAAFYAQGVKREVMLEQHDEIDALNATLQDFRVLKGVEADILADGRLDYDEGILDRFDYVIGSIHSRFKMDGPAMTRRVLRAMDDPHMTILAHPTGRLLLSREPYGIDMNAVLEKAAAVGVAVEVNADPKRLDLDWRYLRKAKSMGVTIEIGPDAHAPRALAWMELGVAMCRKGWLERHDILNARGADDVLSFAKRRFQ